MSVGVLMLKEHAKTITGQITQDDLEYLIKKANKLGLSGREIFSVCSEKLGDNTDVLFFCEEMREKGGEHAV
jgi:hypothetical protein